MTEEIRVGVDDANDEAGQRSADHSLQIAEPIFGVAIPANKQRVDDALLKVAREPGVARRAFEKAVAAVDDDTSIVGVRYGRGSAVAFKNGNAEIARIPDSTVDGSVLRAVGTPPGAVPANKIVDGFAIPCGVVLVIGGGGSGKTPLAHALAGAGNTVSNGVEVPIREHGYAVVRAGEPLSGYIGDSDIIAAAMAQSMLKYANVVVDSIKDLLASKGNTMKGGISRDVVVTVSSWSRVASECGCTLYVPLNPSSNDPELIALLVEAATSNGTMIVYKTSSDEWSYVARSGEGLPRRSGSLTFDKKGELRFKRQKADDELGSNLNSRNVNVSTSVEIITQAMRRSVINDN